MAERISMKEWRWYTERRARDLIDQIKVEHKDGNWVKMSDKRSRELVLLKRLFLLQGRDIGIEI